MLPHIVPSVDILLLDIFSDFWSVSGFTLFFIFFLLILLVVNAFFQFFDLGVLFLL